MSYTYLQEQGEESSAASFADIPASVLLRLSLTLERSCCSASETESCHGSPSGTTSEPLTQNHGGGTLTSCAAGSLAKTSVSVAKGQDYQESAADYGEKCGEWFAKYSPGLFSWKTRQPSLFGGSEESWLTWPRWGMMRDGECWEVKALELPSNGTDYGFWPAMTCSGWRSEGSIIQLRKLVEMGHTTEPEAAALAGGSLRPSRMSKWNHPPQSLSGGAMNRDWGDWLMGWPIGWTGRMPLEMDKFRQWLHSHGESSPPVKPA